MKIGYLTQAGAPNVRKHPLSGPANHVINTLGALQELGHEICLLTYLESKIWKSKDLTRFESVVVRPMDRGPLRWFERAFRRVQHDLKLPYAALFESTRFAWACVQELSGFDLLYERMGWVGYGGALASRWLGVPFFLEINGDLTRELEMLGVAPKGMQKQVSLFLMKHTARAPVRIVSTGEGWRQRFIEQWKVPSDRVVVIENGSEFVSLLNREQLRAFQIVPPAPEPVTLIYVGAFEPWHGLSVLIRASAQAIKCGMPLRLIIAGSGRELPTIVDLIKDLEIGAFVTLIGYLSPLELAHHLAQADIGMSPYCGRAEFSGLKLLDYKAAGLPVIASGEGGQPSVIEDGRTGLIVPPGDEEALCDAICRLTQDASLRRRMGMQARCEAETLHSWKHTAEKLESLFFSFTQGYYRRDRS